MAEEKVKKREWVKNAAIIFLSVMLVLTFFSNTFMNYSLPEVSTKYVESGSINAKIRGSGTVTAAQSYEVTYDQARKVETICVKVGQTVAAGDVLFILEEGDSDELEQAKETLESMELEYQIALLSITDENYYSDKQAINKARDDLADARAAAEKLKPSVTGSSSAVEQAQIDLDEAISSQTEAQKNYDEAVAKINSLSGDADISQSIVEYEKLYAEAEANYKEANESLEKCKDPEEKEKLRWTVQAWENAMKDYNSKLVELANQSESLKAVYSDLYNDMVKAKDELDKKNNKVSAAQEALNTAKENYSSYSKGKEAYEDALRNVESCRDNLNSLINSLEERMEADETAGKIEDLRLADQKKKLEKQRERVAELAGEKGGNEITANTGGIVSEINVAPGGMTGMGSPLAVIELADRGYTLSMTVTAEQAKKVSVGDTAEVENYYWWGDEITAVLESIKNEPQSGGKNKVLTFTVSGGVEPGTNLNLSLGQKSARYDALVPNSAVRNDANGSFVLVLTTKSTPLGNRYVATRVDVKVLASDDVNSAVSGISNGDYVITTSSKPIESGTLVRMAEG